jgi:hypothetical protein
VGLLLIVVFPLFGYHLLQDGVSFNSDQLYCIHFCDDLWQGRDVQGFHMPGAPYVFPDMALLLICRMLTSKIAVQFLLYSFLFYTLLLLVLMAICLRIGLCLDESFSIAGLGVAVLLAYHFDPVYHGFGLLLTYPGNHMGCLLIGLAVIGFTLRAVQTGYHWFSAALMVGVCGSSCFSDQLLIVQYLAPVGGAVLLLGICRLIPFRRSLITIALLVLSVLLAMTIRKLFVQLGFIPLCLERKDPLFQIPLIEAFQQFCASWRLLGREQTPTKIILLFHGLAGLAVLVIWSLQARRSPVLSTSLRENPTHAATESRLDRTAILLVALVLLLAPLSNAGVLIVAGLIEPFAVSRYLYTWWFLPFLCLGLWSRLLPGRLVRFVPGIIVLVVVFRVLTFPDSLSVDRIAPRYPPLARALDELVRKHGPLRGFAEFWRARETRYLTQEHVAVVPILPNGSPWFHAFNPNSYLSDDRHDTIVPDYHFVIFPTSKDESGPDPNQIAARYGKPVEIIPAGEYLIWRYERMRHSQLDLFLRAQLGQRLVREKPYLVPSDPVSLRTPKRNLTPSEARGNIRLQRGQELTIRFDKPVTGAMIDLSANYCDAYTLVFLHDGRALGTARVPPVEWTGAEFVYCSPGLQSRLVSVPSACRSQGFNEVRLIPRGGSASFVVGHFLVFEEWIPYQRLEDGQQERYHRYEGEKLHSPPTPEITILDEAAASGGHSRQATASYQGCIAYGPYTFLAPGRYRIDFALKVTDNCSSDVVATIDSCALRGERILQTRTLRGTQFSTANKYQSFDFTIDTEDELDFVEFRVMAAGKTNVTLDYVDVSLLTAEPTSEACESQKPHMQGLSH